MTSLREALCDERKSYLSPLVHEMLGLDDLPPADIEEPLTEKGTLNWTVFSKKTMAGEHTEDIPQFKRGSKILRSYLVQHIHPFCMKLFNSDVDTILEKYNHYATLLPKVHVLPQLPEEITKHLTHENALFLELISLYRAKRYQLCFSVGVTFFERAINDLMAVLTRTAKSARPMKINSMLLTQEICDVLGEDAMFMIRLVCGPLQGMNFRNLLWHGFFADNEFEPCYASLMIILIASIGELPRVIEIIDNEGKRFPITNMSHYDSEFPVVDINYEQVCNMIDASCFVPVCQRSLWKESIRLYQSREHYYSLSLVFPLLEHALRRMYAFLNNRTERVMSAETEMVYITFDNLVSSQLDFGIGKNKLFDEIDTTIMLALHDILVWTSGPKIRDRLSHGNADPRTIPESVTNRVIATALALVHHYDDREHKIESTLAGYMPAYHPQMAFYPDFKETIHELEHFWLHNVRSLIDYDQNFDYSDEQRVQKVILLTSDTKPEIISLLHDTEKFLQSSRLARGSSFNFHHDDYAPIPPLSTIDVPFVVPTQYGEKIRGNNLSTIEISRQVCVAVKDTIITMRSMITKAEIIRDTKDKKKGNMFLEKYKVNMHSLYLLLTLLMRAVEILVLRLEKDDFEICEDALALSQSLSIQLKTNKWPKKDRVKKFIAVLSKLSTNATGLYQAK